uniref:Uncharacterized protein n=1 Tax=Ditylenchus dipsaci TaxID=166011 RepID=A0A915ED12_9BILA
MSSTISDVFDTVINKNLSGSCIIFTDLIRKDKPVQSSNSGIHNFNNFIKAPQGRFFYEKGPVMVPCSIPFAQRCAQITEAMP